MFCPNCGRQNKENAPFCEYCGKALPQQPKPSSANQAVLSTAPPVKAALPPKKRGLSWNAIKAIVTLVTIVVIVLIVAQIYYPQIFPWN